MKFVTLRVLCEGQTEKNFVTQVLSPHLKPKNVFVRAEPLLPNHYGVVDWTRLQRSIKSDIGRSKDHEFVTTMIDLYKIGRYPGVKPLRGEDVYARVERIENLMLSELPNPRFIPYIQVHEFEALVLVDCSLLPPHFPDSDCRKLSQLTSTLGNIPPEEVDNGEQTAPSKRIIKAIPEYSGLKSTVGPAIVDSIGLTRLRNACPHFDSWITKLEALSDQN